MYKYLVWPPIPIFEYFLYLVIFKCVLMVWPFLSRSLVPSLLIFILPCHCNKMDTSNIKEM